MNTNDNQAYSEVAEAEFREAIIPGKFVRLEYLSDLNEFVKADVLIKQIVSRNDSEWLKLATGAEIPLDRVVSVSGHVSPRFPGYANYSCNC